MSGGQVEEQAEESTLAAEVLQDLLSRILDQQDAAKEGGQYTFQAEELESSFGGGGRFELTRDDTLHLIGVLNSPEVDIAKRELGALLGRLERPAVEGLTRRLFAALRRRTVEMADLEEKVLNNTHKGSAAQGMRRPAARQPVRRNEMPPPAMERRPVAAAPSNPPARSRSKEETFRTAPMSGNAPISARTLSHQPPVNTRTYLQQAPSRIAEAPPIGGKFPQRPPPSKRDEGRMPEVFQRLTAETSGALITDEVVRGAHAALGPATQTGVAAPPLTIGGIPSSESGPQVSAYLEQLLEAHEYDTGIPATSSRRPLFDVNEDGEILGPPVRVPEEKAKEIFDRLYKSGKEHRVRRRVYHELGLLVEQAKEAQTCTFEPRVPLAAYPGGMPPEGSVTERLFRDSQDRKQRRQELMQSAPVPSFRPQTIASTSGIVPNMGYARPGMNEMDHENGGDMLGLGQEEDGIAEDEVMQMSPNSREPTYERLFREHNNRLQRKAERVDAEADWRKHTFRPNIGRSQASGPQVVRSSSYSGLPEPYATQAVLEDGENEQALVATISDEADGCRDMGGMTVDAVDAETWGRPLDTTPRSENGEDGNNDGSQALLLVFPESGSPAPDGFEEELLNALDQLGADRVSEISLRLLDGDCIVAELQGPPDVIAVLRELPLFELIVSGFRVGEVRLAMVPGQWASEDTGFTDSQEEPPPPFTGFSSDQTLAPPLNTADFEPSPRAVSSHHSSPRPSPLHSAVPAQQASSSAFAVPPDVRRTHATLAGTRHMESRDSLGGVSADRHSHSSLGARPTPQLSVTPSFPTVSDGSHGHFHPYEKAPSQMGQEQLLRDVSFAQQDGYTLSRDASSATFKSAGGMTHSSAGPQRMVSGRLAQAFGQASLQSSLIQTTGRGAHVSGSGVRYPSELANMPSALGNYGAGPSAMSPRLATVSAAPQMAQWGTQLGTQQLPATAARTQSLSQVPYGGSLIGSAYGGYGSQQASFVSSNSAPLGYAGYGTQQASFASSMYSPRSVGHPQVMRAAY